MTFVISYVKVIHDYKNWVWISLRFANLKLPHTSLPLQLVLQGLVALKACLMVSFFTDRRRMESQPVSLVV
jgi:hypothetical protein